MTIAFDGTNYNQSSFAPSLSVPGGHPLGAETNRVGIVFIGILNASISTSVSTMTWNSVAMTQVEAGYHTWSSGNTNQFKVYYIPLGTSASSSTPSVDVIFSNSNSYCWMRSASFSGVDQTTPLGTRTFDVGN